MSEAKEVYEVLKHALHKENRFIKLPTYEEAKLSWENELAMQRIKKQAEEVQKLKAREKRVEEERLTKLMLGNVRENFEKTGRIFGDSPLGSWEMCFGHFEGGRAVLNENTRYLLNETQPIAYVFSDESKKLEYQKTLNEARQSKAKPSPHTALALHSAPEEIIPLNAVEIFHRLKSEHTRFGGKPPGISYVPLRLNRTGGQPVLRVAWRHLV